MTNPDASFPQKIGQLNIHAAPSNEASLKVPNGILFWPDLKTTSPRGRVDVLATNAEIVRGYWPDNFQYLWNRDLKDGIFWHDKVGSGPPQSPAQEAAAVQKWKSKLTVGLHALSSTKDGACLLSALATKAGICCYAPAEATWPISLSSRDPDDSAGQAMLGILGLNLERPNGTDAAARAAMNIAIAAKLCGLRGPCSVIPTQILSRSPLAGKAELGMAVSPYFSDYAVWKPTKLPEKVWSSESAWKEDTRVLSVLELKKSRKIQSAFFAPQKINPDEIAYDSTGLFLQTLRQDLARLSAPLSGSQEGVVASTSALLKEGWCPIPFPVAIGHELCHAALAASPAMLAAIGTAAFRYVRDAAFQLSIDFYYGYPLDWRLKLGLELDIYDANWFPGKYKKEKESKIKKPPAPMELPAVLAARSAFSGMSIEAALKKTADDARLGKRGPEYLGLLIAANRITEAAAVFGLGKMIAVPAPSSDVDPVASVCWGICENSIRAQFGFPIRASYAGTADSTVTLLAYPAIPTPEVQVGVTGGRFPWAPHGLASLCGMENTLKWFQ